MMTFPAMRADALRGTAALALRTSTASRGAASKLILVAVYSSHAPTRTHPDAVAENKTIE